LDASPPASVVSGPSLVLIGLSFVLFEDSHALPANNLRGKRGVKGVGVADKKSETPFEEVGIVLWTIFVILLVLWLVGMISSYTLGGFIHLLLVLALIVLILQLVSGRRGPIA